jgi:hypothetical protein
MIGIGLDTSNSLTLVSIGCCCTIIPRTASPGPPRYVLLLLPGKPVSLVVGVGQQGRQLVAARARY